MKSIVLLNFCDGMYGGIESFLLNAFYRLDKKEYDITFLTCGRSTYNMFRDDIIANSGHVEEIPILANNYKNKVRIFKQLRNYFRVKKPDIVHVNSGTLSLQFIASKAAKLENVNRVILHSHNFRPNQTGLKGNLKNVLKKLLVKNGDSFLACSTEAALWMFPKEMVENGNVIIIPNGIDTKKFLFDKKKRDLFRQELGIGEQFVIGNIGRFQKQKNHPFIISVFEELLKSNPHAILLLVGEGELKKEIQGLVKAKNMENNVFLLGERNDMDYFLSAIDVFIFPSLFEGFGIAALEAQASGVRTLLSETITKEVNVTGSAIFLPISGDDAVVKWAEEICKKGIKINRIYENMKVYEAGFDVHLCYQRMIEIYRGESLDDNHK